ncbi:MAG: hypothetical protein ACKVIS_21065, partial [Pseudomonadales bacterium]
MADSRSHYRQLLAGEQPGAVVSMHPCSVKVAIPYTKPFKQVASIYNVTSDQVRYTRLVLQLPFTCKSLEWINAGLLALAKGAEHQASFLWLRGWHEEITKTLYLL